MQIPNRNNLPYYAIATLVAVCGFLGTILFDRGKQCEQERKADRANYELRIKACQDQARIDAMAAYDKLTKYLLWQDSLNQANARQLQKLRKK